MLSLDYYRKNDTHVLSSFFAMGEKAFQIETRFVDSLTGEIVFTSRKTCTFFCHNDGEQYIDKMVDSFKRGLRQRDNLSLDFVCNRVTVEPIPFPNLF